MQRPFNGNFTKKVTNYKNAKESLMTSERFTQRSPFSEFLLAIMSIAILISVSSIEAFSQTSRQKIQTAPKPSQAGDWLLWGGRERNFIAPAVNLASSWPAGGP
ncbi:MAG: hypothetical protein J2P41_16145, partial [Blastocatellia bacterium]|nr:hypothetical protein [Blastocatellia bacterium]